jgi:hypothetical protein
MAENFKSKLPKQAVGVIILLIIAVLSVFVVSKIVTSPSFTAPFVESLDDKEGTVMKLAAASAAIATALSLLPGDAAMPIANQIANLSSYFLLILCAILLEKMLIAVVGYVSFSCIIPVACLLGIAYLFFKQVTLRDLAIKLTIFGIFLFAAIPISVQISDLVSSSYQSSIDQTLETVTQNIAAIEKQEEALSEEDKNWREKISDFFSGAASKIRDVISGFVKRGEAVLGMLINAIAVLLITSCVIPIVVILVFVWIIKILFGFEIPLSKPKRPEIPDNQL